MDKLFAFGFSIWFVRHLLCLSSSLFCQMQTYSSDFVLKKQTANCCFNRKNQVCFLLPTANYKVCVCLDLNKYTINISKKTLVYIDTFTQKTCLLPKYSCLNKKKINKIKIKDCIAKNWFQSYKTSNIFLIKLSEPHVSSA